jgi:glycine betaine/choline ABC-type transport system substrate-binding protein
MKRILAIGLIVMLILGMSGCAQEEKKVVVASKPHSEQYILAEMISQLIETHTDITVEKKLGIGGGTSNIHPAMLKGEIDIYPEYSGTGWLFVLKQDLVNDPQDLFEKTKDMYQAEYNIEWLDLYGFNNTYALAIRESIANELGIETYSDLGLKGKDLVFGAEYDFYEREDGFPALASLYGFDFKEKKELDIGLKYAAIGAGEVDIINAFSTDGLLAEYDLKVLVDDQFYFPSYQATTLVRGETLEKYPELKDVLNKLAGQISDDEMIQMNYDVEKNNMDPVKVAKDFLESKGLL